MCPRRPVLVPAQPTAAAGERLPCAATPPAAPAPLLEQALSEGIDALPSSALVALLIARDVTRPARAMARASCLLARLGDPRRLAIATVGESIARGGLASSEAVRVAAAFALARRAADRPWPRGAVFRTPAEVFERYQPRMRELRKERFLALLLDAKNRIVREDVVSEGSLTSTPVHPREAFGPALREAASGVVFLHNHPSGDPEPSELDHDLTRRLLSSGEILGIRVLDHVVIGDRGYVSFFERGLIPT